MAETSKSHKRRVEEGFFEKYVKGKVIDIGVGRHDTHDGADPLTPDCDTWDKDNGDAHYMSSVLDETYDTVYNSHLLEHLEKPVTAIRSWFRILKSGGHLIMAVPHRDLYEMKTTLPSKWNRDHKFFILPDRCEPPNTFSLEGIIKQALKNESFEIIYIKTCDTCTPENKGNPNEHGDGEYQIEAVVKKL